MSHDCLRIVTPKHYLCNTEIKTHFLPPNRETRYTINTIPDTENNGCKN